MLERIALLGALFPAHHIRLGEGLKLLTQPHESTPVSGRAGGQNDVARAHIASDVDLCASLETELRRQLDCLAAARGKKFGSGRLHNEPP